MPLSDFASHDPEFSQQQVDQCARIVAGLRKINDKIMRLGGPVEALTETADRVEALLESLDPVTQKRAMESYRYVLDLDHPNGVIPFNPATGEFNPMAPIIELAVAGEGLVARCEFTNRFESAPDCVQGGMVAAVYDQLLAYSVMVKGATGPTIWLKVNYLKPTPLHEMLRFETAVESIDGKKYIVKGACYRGDERISEAEGLLLGSYEIPSSGGAQ